MTSPQASSIRRRPATACHGVWCKNETFCNWNFVPSPGSKNEPNSILEMNVSPRRNAHKKKPAISPRRQRFPAKTRQDAPRRRQDGAKHLQNWHPFHTIWRHCRRPCPRFHTLPSKISVSPQRNSFFLASCFKRCNFFDLLAMSIFA